MATFGKASASAALMGILLLGGFAHAADQGITGKKLLLKGPSKFVLLSKDAASALRAPIQSEVPTLRSPSTTAAVR